MKEQENTTRWLKKHRHQLVATRANEISARKDARRKLNRERRDAAGVVPDTGRMVRQKAGVMGMRDEFKKRRIETVADFVMPPDATEAQP